MSRRPNPAADRAAQNQQTLKSLVKIESNKSCADCKRNKHPRWASWNLGIFVCIRCSGIHRGLGTHISRVKSVDLDAWTDDQVQSMLKWGNARANKYWEAKLAPGHVPAEAKMDNFIRTKYDSKRWVMDGPMPDPSTLDTGEEDDTPLSVVQQKAQLDRASSVKSGTAVLQPPRRPQNNIDLFGDEPSQPVRPNTTEPGTSARPAPLVKAPAAAPKQNKPADSLLGLDFFGGTQSAPPARPSSATSVTTPGVPGRSDLKQSILSLYASVPKSAVASSQTSSQQFGGFSSPPVQSPASQGSSFGGVSDAFSSLSFSSPAPQQPVAKTAPFSNLSSPPAVIRQTPSFPSGGSFFDSKPAASPAAMTSPPMQTQARKISNGFGDFGDFTTAAPAAPVARSPQPPAVSSSMGDLFDMSSPPMSSTKSRPPVSKPAETPKQPPPISAASYTQNSAFNLSKPAPAPASKSPAPQANNFSALNNMDAWGSSDAWSNPDPEPPKAVAPPPQTSSMSAQPAKAPAITAISDDFGGWGSNTGPAATSMSQQPTVTEDDDFGGWSSASPVATTAPAPQAQQTSASTTQQKPFGGGDDLFGNVWE